MKMVTEAHKQRHGELQSPRGQTYQPALVPRGRVEVQESGSE